MTEDQREIRRKKRVLEYAHGEGVVSHELPAHLGEGVRGSRAPGAQALRDASAFDRDGVDATRGQRARGAGTARSPHPARDATLCAARGRAAGEHRGATSEGRRVGTADSESPPRPQRRPSTFWISEIRRTMVSLRSEILSHCIPCITASLRNVGSSACLRTSYLSDTHSPNCSSSC